MWSDFLNDVKENLYFLLTESSENMNRFCKRHTVINAKHYVKVVRTSL